MKLVRESIGFERGRDPKTAMGIGIVEENKDPNKRLENFRAAFPEVNSGFNSTSHLHAGYEKHPDWQNINISIRNPKDGISLQEREKKMLNWIKTYTDFDIIDIEHSYDRTYMPQLVKNPVEQYEQHIVFRMRNEEDIS